MDQDRLCLRALSNNRSARKIKMKCPVCGKPLVRWTQKKGWEMMSREKNIPGTTAATTTTHRIQGRSIRPFNRSTCLCLAGERARTGEVSAAAWSANKAAKKDIRKECQAWRI